VDGDPAYLEILDTAGTEQFASMLDLYIKNGQGFVIVYSVTSRQSFQDIKLIRDKIVRVKGTDEVPIVIAANKCDLIGLGNYRREVSTEEGLVLANEWNSPYVETSAKNPLLVNGLFAEVVKEINLKHFKNRSGGTNQRRNKKDKNRKNPKNKSKKCNSKSSSSLMSSHTTNTNSSKKKLTYTSSSSSSDAIIHAGSGGGIGGGHDDRAKLREYDLAISKSYLTLNPNKNKNPFKSNVITRLFLNCFSFKKSKSPENNNNYHNKSNYLISGGGSFDHATKKYNNKHIHSTKVKSSSVI
jgi:small GTP-binding protein